jgi:hypothetical protein
MKLANPYKCDYCDKRKGEANHWWLLFTENFPNGPFDLMLWDDGAADGDNVQHICSEACATKALSQWMGSK